MQKNYQDDLKNIGLESCTFDFEGSVCFINNVSCDVLSMLKKVNLSTGMSIAVESPSYCKDYAKMSCDRTTPIRQYFGKTLKEEVSVKGAAKSGKYMRRASYDVGPDCKSIGGDVKNTITRDWSPSMERLADKLTGIVKKDTAMNTGSKLESFNHVTVLFYLTNPKAGHDERRRVEIGFHTDVNRTPDGDPKPGHPQVASTPTVVLSLGDGKTLRFQKRYSNGSQWDDSERIEVEKTLDHGSFHYLHPLDEMVLHRMVNRSGKFQKEESKSQFMHSVKSQSHVSDTEVKVCVSLCFRQVPFATYYDPTSTLADPNTGEFVKNQRVTEAMKKRDDLKSAVGKKLKYSNGKVRGRIEDELAKYHDKLEKIHHNFLREKKIHKNREKGKRQRKKMKMATSSKRDK